MKINLPELEKPTYKLKELAEKWGCSMSGLLDHAEKDRLQICKQRNSDVPVLDFISDEEKETPFYQNEPVSINHLEARKLEKSSRGSNGPELISLVITRDEKIRFEEKYKTGSIVDSDQDELNSTTTIQTPEDYPGNPGEQRVTGLKELAQYYGLTHDYLKKCWKKNGYPFNKVTKKVYAYPSRMNAFRPPKEKK